MPVPSVRDLVPWNAVPAIPVHAGHGAAIGSFFPGDLLPRTLPAPSDHQGTVQISWYRFGPQRTVDSVHRGRVSAHAHVVHRTQ